MFLIDQGDKGIQDSHGMLYIRATSNVIEVHLRRGVFYELKIKGANDFKPFYTFSGKVKEGNLS